MTLLLFTTILVNYVVDSFFLSWLFFKEDLEKSLLRASREQHKVNPAFKQGDIEVLLS